MSAEMTFWEARSRALGRAMDADPNIVIVGGYFTLPFNPPDPVMARHADRVLWPPISELAVMGFGVGAAMGGLRPFIPVNTSSFGFYGWPQIANEAPNVRYLSGGLAGAPVVFHMFAGSRRGGGAQHEHTPQSMLQNLPGIQIFAPATPRDVDGLIHAAFQQEDPVVIIDHILLANVAGAVPDEPEPRLGRAEILRSGADLLIVTYSLMVQRALAAADALAEHGVQASVLNLRTLVPAPMEDVVEAASGFESVLFVDESRAGGSPATLFMSRVLQELPGVRARLVCSLEAPAPFATHLLDEIVPTAERITAEGALLLGLETSVSARSTKSSD